MRLGNLISSEYEYADSCVTTTWMLAFIHLSERKCRVAVLYASELNRAMRQAVWALLETNMHDL